MKVMAEGMDEVDYISRRKPCSVDMGKFCIGKRFFGGKNWERIGLELEIETPNFSIVRFRLREALI